MGETEPLPSFAAPLGAIDNRKNTVLPRSLGECLATLAISSLWQNREEIANGR